MRSRVTAAIGCCAVLLGLSGCAGNESLAEQYRSGSQQNYVAGNGTVLELAPEARADPVDFSGELDTGGIASTEDFEGQVLVVNFWYAGCPPCRAEAPDLEAVNEVFDDDVAFLGVNVRDGREASLTFADQFGVTYPSVLDSRGEVLLAFSGVVAPNAVPTTLVVDRQARVAARILGQIPDRSVLESLISRVLEEEN